jgi:hypothetical protein
MLMQSFRIPDLLNKLILAGVWPNEKWSTAQLTQQEIDPIIGKEGTQKVSPDEVNSYPKTSCQSKNTML